MITSHCADLVERRTRQAQGLFKHMSKQSFMQSSQVTAPSFLGNVNGKVVFCSTVLRSCIDRNFEASRRGIGH